MKPPTAATPQASGAKPDGVLEQKVLKRFWMSWHQPTEDHRPLTFPPNANILGWWCSGYDQNDVATLCALVEQTNSGKAKRVVLSEWPEAERWRFVNEVAPDYLPGDRFPLPDWSLLNARRPQ